ncbi:tyrosyl-trna synthetase [Rhodotorula toruloides NP11]|uniref:Tyrosine--tRNA ligase n=1 Tax=Rhodotorula toruloides (strain NP11) TaxID=1130832 RepID=M7WUA2_RHOT1|nr:tyrosyl-trna synthetase [Rhodotorula toruloides NP11]EMS24167.1 tyrosyl-trna synthetase [Rhodotorula toruloides NP11]
MLSRNALRLLRCSCTRSRATARSSSASARRANVIRELEERGMLAELTSRAARTHVESPTTVYLGVDPSARSLHVGNLLALIGLLHFRLHGHTAVALIGGATGAIGDPSGRSTERNALSPEVLASNVESITKQFTTFLERGVTFAQSRTRRRDAEEAARGDGGSVKVVNNLDWTGSMTLIDFLSSVGKMARVSTMLSRESVKSRLESSSGISFTEFSYQLLQAYDFLRLHRDLGCTMQLGGSDQLGNIVSGIDLIRRSNFIESGEGEGEAKEDPAFGLTFPLLTTAAGEKFGKSAGNAIWLDPAMTSPFEVYQFFLRTTDEEVEKYLKIFTFIRVVEIEGIMQDHKANPKNRIAQKVLAAEATELIHGATGLNQALAATSVFYGSDLASLITPEIIQALDGAATSSASTAAIPSLLARLPKEEFLGQALEKLAIASGLMASKTQARKAIEAGTIQLNGARIPPKSYQRTISDADLLDGRLVVIKAGKTAHKVVLLE